MTLFLLSKFLNSKLAYYKNNNYDGEYRRTEKYECPKCNTEWEGDPGPQGCPRCGNNMITWKTFIDWVFEGTEWRRK